MNQGVTHIEGVNGVGWVQGLAPGELLEGFEVILNDRHMVLQAGALGHQGRRVVGPVFVIKPQAVAVVQTVPGYESIDVGVSRNSISENPTIITAFNGGFGLGMTERMDVTVIRSDGIVETGH